MSDAQPVLDQLNLVVASMEATRAFYATLGIDVPDSWKGHHAEVKMPNGTTLEFDSPEMARTYNAGMAVPGDASRAVIGFTVPTRAAVDELYAAVVAAGHTGRQEPYDAFWGSRYAIVTDPDGNDVGLMSPVDAAFKGAPPDLDAI